MSAIYFHAEQGEARVRGSERAYAGVMCRDLFAMALGVRPYMDDGEWARIVALFPERHYLRGMEKHNGESLRCALAVEGSLFEQSLNTMLVLGSDAVKLLARLHGQCEIHTYVAGEDRAWLADLIENGRETGVLRAAQGWEDVVALLRTASDAPVVTSYSVCDQFPNSHVAGWKSQNDGDDWYELPDTEQWRLALAGLYADGGLRIDPATWQDFYFGDGTTAFDLIQPSPKWTP